MRNVLSLAADAYFYVALPPAWPRWVRRAFILTLPLSGPLLVCWWLLLPLGAAVMGFALMIVLALAWVAYPFGVVVAGLVDLWREA